MKGYNNALLEVVRELVRRAHYALLGSTEKRILSEGGVLTACKCYIKSAILIMNKLDPGEDFDLELVLNISEMLTELATMSVKKLDKFNTNNYAVQKRLQDIKRHARWALNVLEKKTTQDLLQP